MAPYAVNWQVKESPVGAGSEVRTDLEKLLTLIRLSGYRGYLPIETLSARGQDYDPFRWCRSFWPNSTGGRGDGFGRVACRN